VKSVCVCRVCVCEECVCVECVYVKSVCGCSGCQSWLPIIDRSFPKEVFVLSLVDIHRSALSRKPGDESVQG